MATRAPLECFLVETYKRGKRLKELRGARSHQEVATALSKALRRTIGKGTVWKWEKVDSPNIELDVFFALADFYEIDPRELAIGKKSKNAALPLRRQNLILAYGRLPADARTHIRGLIEALDAALSPTYRKWSEDMAEKARRRDAVHET